MEKKEKNQEKKYETGKADLTLPNIKAPHAYIVHYISKRWDMYICICILSTIIRWKYPFAFVVYEELEEEN